MEYEDRVINGYVVRRYSDGRMETRGPAGNSRPSGPQPVQVSPGDPMQPRAAQAGVTNTEANTGRTVTDTRITEATAPSTIGTANLEPGYMWVDPSNPGAGQTPIPIINPRTTITDARRGELRDRERALQSLAVQIDRAQELFDQGPGQTRGIPWGAQDFFPSEANDRFNQAMAEVGLQAQGAFRIPGSGDLNEREVAMMEAARNASSWTRDGRVDEILNALRRRVDTEYNSLRGELPEITLPQWRQSELERFQPSAMDQTFITAGPSAMETGSGQTSIPIPPGMQQEFQTWLLSNAGTMTPESYAAERVRLDQKYGFGESDPSRYLGEGRNQIDAIQNGGTLNLTIPPVNRDLTELETSADAAVRNPVGAAAVGLGNAAIPGAIEAFNPEQYAALRNERPLAVLGGEIVGSLAGTAGLGALAREAAKRAAPRLLGGGRTAQFGRNLATDIAYSGAYGGMSGQGALESAVEGGVGSIFGQGVGRVLGGAVSGVNVSPAVDYLRSRNIPLTTGQTLGGMADRVEQRAMSIPLVGDMIRNRRIDGIEAFNQTALNDAGAPIGARPNAIGQEGLDQLGQSVSDAYTNATAGTSVPIDPQMMQDLSAAARAARMLPPDYQPRFEQVMDNRVQPAVMSGQMTGEQFQQARRGLAGSRASASGAAPGFEQEYREALTLAEDALTNQMMRGGGAETVSRLSAANAANRNFRTVENAAERNIGGTNTDMPFVFTPNQLQRAGLRTEQRFPGPRPFADLADNAQQVLPQTIPNSGTADRAMQALIPSLAAGGAGVGYLAGGDGSAAGTGAAIPTAAMILAALGGTRQGQRAINAMLTQRPASARALADAVRRNTGLFGGGSGALGSAMIMPTIALGRD
jgi:hypothetical protein